MTALQSNKSERALKETPIYWQYERITSLRGSRSLAYLVDKSRLLCSVRLVLHLVRLINQRLLNLLDLKGSDTADDILFALAQAVIAQRLPIDLTNADRTNNELAIIT